MQVGHMSKNGTVELSRRELLDGQKTSKIKLLSIVFSRNRKWSDLLQKDIIQREYLSISIQILEDQSGYLQEEVFIIY